MKWISVIVCLLVTLGVNGQNHSKKPIRFIFESIHDHMGNMDVNSKRVQLFSTDHRLLYEADMYDGKELDEQFFYYDKSGKLLRDHRIFHRPHESGDFRMTYDAKGNLVSESNVNDIGEVLEKITMTYNDKGQMISEKKEFFHHEQAKMITESYFDITYGADGKIASKTGWEGEKEDLKVTYKYKHEAASETEMKYDASDKIIEKMVKTYDEKGRIVSEAHSIYNAGQAPVTTTIELTYDEHDHLLSETKTKSNSQVKMQILFEYVYDDYGNWIERKEKKIKGVRELPGNHLKRHIEYYEHDKYEHPPMELDESYTYEKHEGKSVKMFQETHVRINNNEGQLEWVVRRNGPDLFQVDEFEYENGKLSRINHLNNEGHENAYTLAQYNDQGLMTEMASYSFEGKVDERTLYAYDSRGVLIKKEEQFAGASHGPVATQITEEFKYGGDGKISEVHMVDYGAEYVVTYEYDAEGRVAKEIQTPKAKDDDVITLEFTYKNGLLISEIEHDGKNKEAADEARYEYDEHGELIKASHYRHGEIHSEIDYMYFE